AGIGGARSRGFAGGRGDLLVGGRVGTAVHPASAFLSACSREHQNVPPCVPYPTERGRRGFPKWARRLRGSNQNRIDTGVELGKNFIQTPLPSGPREVWHHLACEQSHRCLGLGASDHAEIDLQ